MTTMAKLCDICRVEKGKTGIKKATPGQYPLVVTAEDRLTHSTYDFDAEAVCVPLVSSTGHGRASLNRVHYQSGRFALGTILAAVIPNNPDEVSAKYLYAYLAGEKDRVLVPLMRGGANVTLTVGALKGVEVPLPSIDAQCQIAAKYEKAVAYTSSLDALHGKVEQGVADLRQTILQLAVMGRLVPQDPHDEPASELLKKIETAKQRLIEAGKIRKTKQLPEVELEELPFALPPGWLCTRWGNVSEWITYGFTRPMPHVDEGPAIVTAKNVLDNRIDLNTADRTTVESYDGLNDKDRPRPGDILITKDGSIGRVAVVPRNLTFCISQSVAVIWLRSCMFDRQYLAIVLRSALTKDQIQRRARGQAIKHLYITDLAKYVLPLPPLAEQHRIVEKVDALMTLCDELETKLKQSQADGKKLMASIVNHLVEAV